MAVTVGLNSHPVTWEVTTMSRLRETGELVEFARTSWLASRVRFTFGRSLTLGQIDMSELMKANQLE